MSRPKWPQAAAGRCWTSGRRFASPLALVAICALVALTWLSLLPVRQSGQKSPPEPEERSQVAGDRWLLFGGDHWQNNDQVSEGSSYNQNNTYSSFTSQSKPENSEGQDEGEAISVLAGASLRRPELLSFKENAGDPLEMSQNGGRRRRSWLPQAALLKRRFKRRADRKPILNEFSFPANLVQGMRFVLMCQVLDGEPPIQIKWFKDDQELTGAPLAPQLTNNGLSDPTEQVELVSNEELGGASLLFRRAQRQHGGNYTCVASNHFGATSYSSVMTVKVPPSWKVEPQDQESIMGAQMSIDCQASGNPNPFIRWKFAQSLPQQQQQHLAQLQAGQADAASNNNNNNNNNLNEAELSQQTGPSNLAGNQNFKLITSNHQVQTLENGSLAFRQLHKEHEGLYLCEADNGVEPNLIKVIRLQVRLQAQFLDELQVLGEHHQTQDNNNSYNSNNLRKGVPSSSPAPIASASASQPIRWARVGQNASQLRLLCQPFGELPLTLDWLKDGQLIYTHSTSSDLSSLSPSLTSSSSPSASSNGQLLPATGFGNQLDLVGRLHVNTRRGSTSATGTVNQRNALNQQQQQQQQHQHWLNNHLIDSELVLTNLRRQDGGVYSCQARNAYGQAERQIRLLIQEPPEPPEVVDVAHIGSRSIGLRWLAPFDGNSVIVKYLVEYKRQSAASSSDNDNLTGSPGGGEGGYLGQSEKVMATGKQLDVQPGNAGNKLYAEPALLLQPEMQQQQQHQQGQQVQHTLHELDPLTRYSLRVVAVNAIGRSKPSVALSLRTEEEVPSSLPTMVEASVLSSKSIKLRWTISYSPEREVIEGFFVGYRSFEASPSSSAPISGLGDVQTSKQQQSAEQPTFTYKTIRLTSRTGAAGAPTSAATAAALAQDNTGSEATFRQQLSEAATGGAAFLSPVASITKTIAASPPFSGNSHRQYAATSAGMAGPINVVVSSFEYIIGSLERNTEYTILIQCFNKKGAGPTSDPVVFRTFMNDPPEKLALNADEITESSVRVSWKFIGSNYIERPLLPPPLLPAPPTQQSSATSINRLLEQPVDGYVLTFSKLRKHLSHDDSDQQVNRSESAAAARISQVNPTATSSIASQFVNGKLLLEQWQTVQLAPQQRNHQLKNLECGTSYAMKIWAFNKIGKGEPSDLITVSTRGKAPVAPDRRSFIATNSSQVRLHLSAWYDGGCEIDKFIVQYRARGQSEWILISNNILKEQASLLIRDLIPATSYELLVSAQNQVGPTEVRYRFTTLDADGKQVSNGLSIFGNQVAGNDNSPDSADYLDESGWHEMWPSRSSNGQVTSGSGGFLKLILSFRHLLNSPLALLCSLSLFLLLLILFVFHRRPGNQHHHGSSSSASTANTLTSSSAATNKSSSSASCNGRRLSTEATILGDMEGPLSIANGSLTDSPARLPLQQVGAGAFQPPPVIGNNYQSFCGGAQNQPSNSIADYGQLTAAQAECLASPYMHPTYGTASHQHHHHHHQAQSMALANHYSLAGQAGPYASVQRSATLEPQQMATTSGPNLVDNHTAEQQQQCLMQMLLMGSRASDQQQQQQQPPPPHSSFVTSLTRNKSANSHANFLGYSNTMNHRTVSLARPTSDYQRPQNN